MDTTTHLPLHYDQLMSEHRILCLKRPFDLNGEANRVSKKQSSAIIAVDVRRFGHVINKDEVFGTHNAFTNFVTGFIEYDYYDFGNRDLTFVQNNGRTFIYGIDETKHVVKAGLNFRFGGYGYRSY